MTTIGCGETDMIDLPFLIRVLCSSPENEETLNLN